MVQFSVCPRGSASASWICVSRARGPEDGEGSLWYLHLHRYLQNGNILATRSFLSHFVLQLAAKYPEHVSTVQASPIAISKGHDGQQDEIVLTKDPVVNWAQLAVRTCQRAQGDKNKAMREAWVRLCGTYQSRGGLLATKEVRKVSSPPTVFLIFCVSRPA